MHKLLFIAIVVFLLTSCQEGAFYERNSVIPGQLWDNGNKPEFKIDVLNKQDKYKLFLNLRHTAYYPYANFSFLIKYSGKSAQDTSVRYEMKLAETDGRWLGNTAGNLYEQSKLLMDDFTFPDTGKYVFSIQQNMRENPLRGINDVGIKLIKK